MDVIEPQHVRLPGYVESAAVLRGVNSHPEALSVDHSQMHGALLHAIRHDCLRHSCRVQSMLKQVSKADARARRTMLNVWYTCSTSARDVSGNCAAIESSNGGKPNGAALEDREILVTR
jgi:hypothetical protein